MLYFPFSEIIPSGSHESALSSIATTLALLWFTVERSFRLLQAVRDSVFGARRLVGRDDGQFDLNHGTAAWPLAFGAD